MKLRAALLLCLLLLAIPLGLFAQYYMNGQEPASTRWKELKTSDFRIIYPSSRDSLAFRYALHVDSLLPAVHSGLGGPQLHFPIVLRTRNATPNAFVSWAPRRIEIYTVSSLDSDPDPWVASVSTHELRHIVQMRKLKTGTSRLLYWLFGESGTGMVAGLVPPWFMEGDAVYTETAWGRGGRGREALFLDTYRTHMLTEDRSTFSYDKWLLGSYKHFVPNHYAFGYLMTGYVNERFGPEVWERAMNFTAQKPFTFFPFYFELKKSTDLSRKAIFNASLASAQSFWRAHADSLELSNGRYITLQQKDHVEYQYLTVVDSSSLIALKKTLGKIPELVLIHTPSLNEQSLHQPGVVSSKPFFSQGYLFWSEFKGHYRFGQVSFSIIYRMHLATKAVERVTPLGRFFNPIILGNGNLLAIEYMDNGTMGVSVFRPDGSKASFLRMPETEVREIAPLSHDEFVIRAVCPQGNMLLRCNSQTTKIDTLLHPVAWNISDITFREPGIVFSASQDGVQEIIYFNPLSRKNYKLFNSTYSLYNPVLLSDQLIVAAESNMLGNRLVEFKIDSLLVNPIYGGPGEFLFRKSLAQERLRTNALPTKQPSSFEIKPYNRIKNLLHFHSWSPFFYNPFELDNEAIAIRIGAMVASQNITSTAIATAGYSYAETHGFHGAFQWLGWYPVISASVDHGELYRRAYGNASGNGTTQILSSPRTTANVGIFLPTQLTWNRYVSQLNPAIVYSYRNDLIWDGSTYKSHIDFLNLSLSFYRLKRMAFRDLRPKWGISSFGIYTMSPRFENLIGNSTYLRVTGYLPGLAANHSLLLTSRYEKKTKRDYSIGSRTLPPRGIEGLKRFESLQSVSLDYSFPIVYPDLNIGPLIYIKRIFGNLFSDNAHSAQWENSWLNTVGIDLNANTHLFRTRYALTIGYRIGYAFGGSVLFHDFLFNFDISSIAGHNPRQQLLSLRF